MTQKEILQKKNGGRKNPNGIILQAMNRVNRDLENGTQDKEIAKTILTRINRYLWTGDATSPGWSTAMWDKF